MFDVEKIRGEFPILSRRVYGKPLVYLDSGATAQKPRCVIEQVDALYRGMNANIHRGVHLLSEEATERYEAARSRIDLIMPQLARSAGATEALKATDPMKWVGLMNTCKAQAEEIVKFELIYV